CPIAAANYGVDSDGRRAGHLRGILLRPNKYVGSMSIPSYQAHIPETDVFGPLNPSDTAWHLEHDAVVDPHGSATLATRLDRLELKIAIYDMSSPLSPSPCLSSGIQRSMTSRSTDNKPITRVSATNWPKRMKC
ncbi:hypothetical protein THAOC_28927, partial [Thalassiosira oceanica]